MRKVLIVLVAIVTALLGITSCEDNDNDGILDITFPDSNVSYSKHVKPVLAASCGLSGCHGEVTGVNANPMYDYYTLVESIVNIGVVVKLQPNASRLIEILEYRGTQHTPYYKWHISENQKQGIRVWIEEGALNN